MNIIDIITKKKNSEILSKEEINYFVANINEIEKCQISALMMAICINKMTDNEIVDLTLAMADSGDKLDLSMFENCVDKHSTGGVGDKVSLVIAPIVASLGCNVCKMSGKGLGYTGGTIDKLESLGMNMQLLEEDFIKQVEDINICIMSQTKNIAPADKIMYAVRDITATVESTGLIAASIMSKKIASGAKNLIIDVKVGTGAFMKDIESAKELAKMMKRIGELTGMKVKCILTNMDTPLGCAIGNKLEVKEAYEILDNKGDSSLREICITVAANMISITKDIDYETAKNEVLEVLNKKIALEKFKKFVEYQGGTLDNLDNENVNKKEIFAQSTGYISKIDALSIGKLSCSLGAGKLKLDDKIDYDAGVVLNKSINEYVEQGDLLLTLYSKKEIKTDINFKDIINISDSKVNVSLIHEII